MDDVLIGLGYAYPPAPSEIEQTARQRFMNRFGMGNQATPGGGPMQGPMRGPMGGPMGMFGG